MPPVDLLASVIIPSARSEMVFSTIEGILLQTLAKERFEIIVVTPETGLTRNIDAANLRSLQVEQLYPPGKMRNVGARHARGQFLFLSMTTAVRRWNGWPVC